MPILRFPALFSEIRAFGLGISQCESQRKVAPHDINKNHKYAGYVRFGAGIMRSG
jgi:hypothetical protein